MEVQEAMVDPVPDINFDFLDPVEQLVRLLVCSPLAADTGNLCFAPEITSEYYDLCSGERWRRIHATLPEGGHALTCLIFFDEIYQDQKQFVSGEAAIIVGGNFRIEQRESTYAKSSFATFPAINFPKVNQNAMKL